NLCRVTGGGNDDFVDVARHNNGVTNAITHGGQAGAPASAGGQDFGEWTHTNHNGPAGQWTFHAGTHSAPPGTEILSIACCDSQDICHAQAHAPDKQIDFDGIGTFKNIHSSDFGSPVAVNGAHRTF